MILVFLSVSVGFLRFDFSAILFIFYFTIASYSPVDFSSPYRRCSNYRDQQAVVLTIGLTPKQTWKLTYRGEEPLHLLWEAHLEMSKWFAQLPKFICCTPREEFEPSESIMGGVFLQTGQVLPTDRKYITSMPKTLSSISKLSVWQGKQQTLSLPRVMLSPCHFLSS